MRMHRPQRAESLIQQELSKIILKEIDFPVGALVTVSWVSVSPDMMNAKVGVSILPKKMEENSMAILKKMQGFLQHVLNNKMNIRPMPRIDFEIDHGSENAADIERLLINK